MSSNAFNDPALGLPKPVDLRRAAEVVLAWRKGDAHLGGVILAEAEREGRVGFLIAAMAFVCNKELDNTAAAHGEDAVEGAIRTMIGALAATEGNQS